MNETERYEIAGLAETYARAAFAHGRAVGASAATSYSQGAAERARKRDAESDAHAVLLCRLVALVEQVPSQRVAS